MSIDWNRLKDYDGSGDIIYDEAIVVPAGAPYQIFPEFWPQKNTPTSIELWTGPSGAQGTQYTEKTDSDQVVASGDFYVNYNRGGRITNYADAAGLTLYMKYLEIGTFDRVKYLNSVKDAVGSGDISDFVGNSNLVNHANDDTIHGMADHGERHATGSGDPVDIYATQVNLEQLYATTYNDIQDWANLTQSAGLLTGGVISSGGPGVIDVTAGTGFCKATDSETGVTEFIDWGTASSLALTDNAKNTIYIDRSDRSVHATDDPATDIDHTTKFTIGAVYREGNAVYILHAGTRIYNWARRGHKRARELRSFERASGLAIADDGSLEFSVTTGIVYAGYARISITGASSGTDKFTAYYRDGAGGWTTLADQTVISNIKYDDGTGTPGDLTAAAPYGVHWIYMDMDGHLFDQYGQDKYKLSDAIDATVPDAPTFLDDFAILVGKIIVERNGTELHEALSAFVTQFAISAAVDHNDLGNINGGKADEYYHTTTGQHSSLTGSGDSIQHYHATDRARANHTGTQTKSTISDFSHASDHYDNGVDELDLSQLKPSGDIDINGYKITASDMPTASGDLANKQYVDDHAGEADPHAGTHWNGSGDEIDLAELQPSGNVSMAGNILVNMATALASGDATNKKYIDEKELNTFPDSSDQLLTVGQKASLVGSGDSIQHHHDSDRARSAHTGTQVRSTISDFAHQGTHHSGSGDALDIDDLADASGRVLSAGQLTDLTDSGDAIQHYHATDRARTNHTGTQTKSTISDFAHEGTHHNGSGDALDIDNLADSESRLLTGVNKTDLTDGGETSLHSHAGTGLHAGSHFQGSGDAVDITNLDPPSGDVTWGGHKITGLATPTASGDAANKKYVDAAAGDVTASANITDHEVVRGDGGAKGVQGSGVKIDDTGNLTMASGDIKTDRWLNSDTNTLIGVGVAGAGNLSHPAGDYGYWNTAIGYQALYSNTTAQGNAAYGYDALYANTVGNYNAAYGHSSLLSNVDGAGNSAFGISALHDNISGGYNAAFGLNALYNNTTGSKSVALGYGALLHMDGIGRNIGIGYQAGDNITTGSYNIIIGDDLNADSATGDYQLNIGGIIKGNMDTEVVTIPGTLEVVTPLASGDASNKKYIDEKELNTFPDANDQLLTVGQKSSLTGSGDSIQHYHDSDRARANHTGTQTRSTISDFAHAGTHWDGSGDVVALDKLKPTNDVDWDGNKITGLATPTVSGDAANRKWVNDVSGDITADINARAVINPLTADIDAGGSYQIVDLQAPSAAGETIRQTAKITETNMEAAHDHVASDGSSHSLSHTQGTDDTITVANEATDETCFPLFVTAATGDLGPKTNAGLSFDSSTAILTAAAFVGALTGEADTVTNATLTTALTVNTGTLTLTADVANNSVLTIGAGASSISGANTGDQTTISGNAATATILETARDINGVSFNGSANITVTADANTLTNTTLKSTVVNSSLTSLGTIGSLVATTADINGGTVDEITSLTVANNVDIGAFDLRAATLTADGLTSGRVVFATTNGQLTDDSDMTYSDATGLVTTYGFFHDRGNTATIDYVVGDFTTDDTWRDLDLSSIVPAGAKAVLLYIKVLDNAAGSWMKFKRKGNADDINIGQIQTQVANISQIGDLIIPCDVDRIIEYLGFTATFVKINVTVKGWFK